jgi:predicted membrane-bound mannosyltransferase/sugar lactone lactonase YvrE
MTHLYAQDEGEESWFDRAFRTAAKIDAEVVLYTLILLLALLSRFYGLGARVMSHDETTHVFFSWQFEQGSGYSHDPLSHGPLQFHLIALSYLLFGDSDATARLPSALFGVIAVGMMILFRRWLGRTGALVAAFLMLISPYMLYYSRYARNESLVVPFALAGVWSMLRYLETRQGKWLYLFTLALALNFSTKETAFIFTAQIGIFLIIYQVWGWMRDTWENRNHLYLFLGGLGASLVGGVIGIIGYRELRALGAAEAQGEAAGGGLGASPLLVLGLAIGLIGVALLVLALIRAYGERLRGGFPAFDLLLVIGTMCLPLIAALPATILGWDPLAYDEPSAYLRTAATVAALIAVSAAIGLLWDIRRWPIVAGLFYVPFVALYTSMFTNGRGLATGLVGSLGYWLVQQGVERGSQPLFYYALIQIPIYEFLPALGALVAALYGVRGWSLQRSGEEGMPPAGDRAWLRADVTFPVPLLLGYWALSSLVAYSIAGERMPWLTVHIALPMIMFAAWGLAKFLDSIDWNAFLHARGWMLAGLMLPLTLAVMRAFGSLAGANPPFAGQELDQLSSTMGFIASLLVAGVCAAALVKLAERWAFVDLLRLGALVILALLALITARSAFRAAYVNYDLATEYLVYAHSGPGPKLALNQIDDLSERLTGGKGLDVAYDNEMLYPYWWYLRHYPNAAYFASEPSRDLLEHPIVVAGAANWSKVEPILGDRYESFKYVRLWWPNQDYWKLKYTSLESEWRMELPEDVRAQEPKFTPGDYLKQAWKHIRPFFANPGIRKAVWEIWFNRDFSAYAQATGRDFSLQNWDPRNDMKLYIRKDVAAMVWDYGVSSIARQAEEYVDPYAEKFTTLFADQIIGSAGQGVGQFNAPRGLAAASDGSIYVADTMNNRIQHLSPDGEVLAVWGQRSDQAEGPAPEGTFQEPWGVAVAPDDTVYVADTWNHRIQHFSPEGEFLGAFGTYGQGETSYAFWGPRDVAVDGEGRIFVADTGNKRIVVFDPEGNPLTEFGGVGTLPGYLDEPVGVDVDAQGRVYVADTWNQRVQVFEEVLDNVFDSVGEWPIDGWFGESVENKPYLAVSDAGMVCVTDPEGYRVLCFTAGGEFLGGWGSSGESESQFGIVGGLDFSADCVVWVADSGNSRLMRFPLSFCPAGVSP